jgi:hypothetical protein
MPGFFSTARQHGSANQVMLSAPTPSQRQSSLGERRRFHGKKNLAPAERSGLFGRTRLFHWNADVARRSVAGSPTDGKPKLFCLPPKKEVTTQQAAEIMIHQAKDVPDADNYPISILLLAGLTDTFRCEEQTRRVVRPA